MDFKIGDKVVFNKLQDTFISKVTKIISESPPIYEIKANNNEVGQQVHECMMMKPTRQQLIK